MNNNICVICLEPLLKAVEDEDEHAMCDIGTASCGHPAHCSCFDSWAEFQRAKSREGEGVPCPTCQQVTTSFTKIFLRAETPKPDFALSDDEEDEEEEDCANNENTKPDPPSVTTTSSKSRRNNKTANSNNKSKTVHKKKVQYYKKRWMGKSDEVKSLKLEAKNRKKCHHDDLVDLERSQLLNFRLMKQLEHTIKAARFRRNAIGAMCFVLGWVCSRKFRFS